MGIAQDGRNLLVGTTRPRLPDQQYTAVKRAGLLRAGKSQAGRGESRLYHLPTLRTLDMVRGVHDGMTERAQSYCDNIDERRNHSNGCDFLV